MFARFSDVAAIDRFWKEQVQTRHWSDLIHPTAYEEYARALAKCGSAAELGAFKARILGLDFSRQLALSSTHDFLALYYVRGCDYKSALDHLHEVWERCRAHNSPVLLESLLAAYSDALQRIDSEALPGTEHFWAAIGDYLRRLPHPNHPGVINQSMRLLMEIARRFPNVLSFDLPTLASTKGELCRFRMMGCLAEDVLVRYLSDQLAPRAKYWEDVIDLTFEYIKFLRSLNLNVDRSSIGKVFLEHLLSIPIVTVQQCSSYLIRTVSILRYVQQCHSQRTIVQDLAGEISTLVFQFLEKVAQLPPATRTDLLYRNLVVLRYCRSARDVLQCSYYAANVLGISLDVRIINLLMEACLDEKYFSKGLWFLAIMRKHNIQPNNATNELRLRLLKCAGDDRLDGPPSFDRRTAMAVSPGTVRISPRALSAAPPAAIRVPAALRQRRLAGRPPLRRVIKPRVESPTLPFSPSPTAAPVSSASEGPATTPGAPESPVVTQSIPQQSPAAPTPSAATPSASTSES